MPESRGSRFALEVLFLVALAIALTLAELRPLLIGGMMLLGWLIVALLEWAASRNEPHFGSGLPPRYYVPQVSLPPRRPLEQVGDGYPAGRDEAPTWIASPALRAEVLGEWPVAARAADDAEADVDTDESVDAREPDAVPVEEELAAAEAESDAEAADAEPVAEAADEAEPAEEPEPAEVVEALEPTSWRRRLWGRRGHATAPEDPWEAEELPVAAGEPDAEAAAEEDEVVAAAVPVVVGDRAATARHTLDPLKETAAKRWWQRGGADEATFVEVPARPAGVRPLPGRSTGQD